MKVKNVSNEKDFKPVSISITLESEDEVRALYMIMNYRPITHADHIRGNIDGEAIRDSLGIVDYQGCWFEFCDSLTRGVNS